MPYKISYKTTNFLYRDTEIEAIQSCHSFIFPEAFTPFFLFNYATICHRTVIYPNERCTFCGRHRCFVIGYTNFTGAVLCMLIVTFVYGVRK